MTTPWPAEVLDCAKRLAKSLGYEDSNIVEKHGEVSVFREFVLGKNNPNGHWTYDKNHRASTWHLLDPRDPTVWSALIGDGKVMLLRYYFWDGQYSAQTTLLTSKADYHWYKHPGLAVCEAYNALKGNPRGKAKPAQKFSTEEICGFFKVPIDILR